MRLIAAFVLLLASTALAIEPRLTARTEAKKPTSYILKTKSGTTFHVAEYEEFKVEYRVRLINGIGTKFNKDDVLYITPQFAKVNARDASVFIPPAEEEHKHEPAPSEPASEASSPNYLSTKPVESDERSKIGGRTDATSVLSVHKSTRNTASATPPSEPTPKPKQSSTIRANPVVSSSAPIDRDETTVYVTKTGSKYHSAGCPHLSKSKIPISLEDAKGRYSPCSVCGGGSAYRDSGRSTARSSAPTASYIASPSYSSSTGERTATGIPIHTGPRGGKYHYSASGKKVYERKK